MYPLLPSGKKEEKPLKTYTIDQAKAHLIDEKGPFLGKGEIVKIQPPTPWGQRQLFVTRVILHGIEFTVNLFSDPWEVQFPSKSR